MIFSCRILEKHNCRPNALRIRNLVWFNTPKHEPTSGNPYFQSILIIPSYPVTMPYMAYERPYVNQPLYISGRTWEFDPYWDLTSLGYSGVYIRLSKGRCSKALTANHCHTRVYGLFCFMHVAVAPIQW